MRLFWLILVSDFVVWLTTQTILLWFLSIVRRRRREPFIRWLFVSFLVACNVIQVLGMIVLLWPVPEMLPITNALTVIVLWTTAVVLFFLVSQPSPELQAVNDRLLASEKELRAVNDTLSLRVRSLEGFTYSVSHDLNAPLRGLEGFSEALIQDEADHLSPTGKDYLHRIMTATKRMRRLVNDVQRLSQITTSIELHQRTFSLSHLAEDIIGELREQHEGSAKYQVKITPGLVVTGDYELIKLALYNLLDNAWKYSSKCEHPVIEVGKVDTEVYYVKDNGIGFDSEANATRLFQPFSRLHASADYPGTGVGLAIVRRVIDVHFGKVWTESRPNEGATFFFTLGDIGNHGNTH